MTDVKDRKKALVCVMRFSPRKEDYTYDFSNLDKYLKGLLDADPKAYILFGIQLEMLA